MNDEDRKDESDAQPVQQGHNQDKVGTNPLIETPDGEPVDSSPAPPPEKGEGTNA